MPFGAYRYATKMVIKDAMRVVFASVIGLLAVAACSKSPAANAQQQQQMPPAEVGVVTVKTESVTLQAELAGRTTASLASDVRPQISGIIKARTFAEGAKVQAGQVLYVIDPAMYRATFASAC